MWEPSQQEHANERSVYVHTHIVRRHRTPIVSERRPYSGERPEPRTAVNKDRRDGNAGRLLRTVQLPDAAVNPRCFAATMIAIMFRVNGR